ncbi:MAG TPA: transglutaminase-like domain-containing protein [Kofleriaceae bacterium]|jgi:hypothetical protein
MKDDDDRLCGTRSGRRYRVFDERTAALHLACHAAPAHASLEEQLELGTATLRRMTARGLPQIDGAVDGDELLNFCRAVEDDAWKHGMLSEFRRMCALYEPGMQRRARGEESRARFVLRHRRRWFFDDKSQGDPVRLSFALPIDDELRRTVRVDVVEAGGCRSTVSADSVVLRGAVPNQKFIDAEIRIESVLDCDASRLAEQTGPDLSTWLSLEEPGIPCSPRVAALAHEWTAGRSSGLEQIRALWDELERRLVPGFLHSEDDKIDPLELGWADCKTSSSLLVAMTRHLGIPARLVSGVLLVKERPCDFHFWMEAWLPDRGWTPFDWLATVALCDPGNAADRWRYHFFGQLDYRLVHTRFPNRFASLSGARLPKHWYRVETGVGTSRIREYRAEQGNRPIFTDTFQVEELSWI